MSPTYPTMLRTSPTSCRSPFLRRSTCTRWRSRRWRRRSPVCVRAHASCADRSRAQRSACFAGDVERVLPGLWTRPTVRAVVDVAAVGRDGLSQLVVADATARPVVPVRRGRCRDRLLFLGGGRAVSERASGRERRDQKERREREKSGERFHSLSSSMFTSSLESMSPLPVSPYCFASCERRGRFMPRRAAARVMFPFVSERARV